MGIKMSQKIPRWYVMALWSMRGQKFIDQLSCEIPDIMKKKWPTGGHFGFHNCEICHGLPLCETLHFVYIQGPAILHFLVRPA